MAGPLRIHNPDDKPVAAPDPIEERAGVILYAHAIHRETVQGKVFRYLFRKAGGRPGKVPVTYAELLENKCANNDAAIRDALTKLASPPRSLLQVSRQRYQRGPFEVAVMEDLEPAGFLPGFEPALPEQPGLRVTGQESETQFRNHVSDCETETEFRNRISESPPAAKTEKNPDLPKTEAEQEFERLVRQRQQSAGQVNPPASVRDVLERSNVLRSKSIAQHDVQERSNVEKRAADGTLSAEAAEILRLVDRIGTKIGDNRRYPWMPFAVACLLVDGLLTRNEFEGCLESTGNWKKFTGAIKNHLAAKGREALCIVDAWDNATQQPRFPMRRTEQRLQRLGLPYTRAPPDH